MATNTGQASKMPSVQIPLFGYGGLYALISIVLFGLFIANAATVSAGAFVGGTATGLFATTATMIVVFFVVSYILFQPHMSINSLLSVNTLQIAMTCVALFFAISAIEITYIQKISS